METTEREGAWPARPLVLGGLGAAAGLTMHFIAGEPLYEIMPAWRVSLMSLVFVGAVLFGFTVERRSIVPAAIFALAGGLVAALILYWNGPTDRWSSSEGWRVVSLALAIAIAAPLFQAGRDSREAEGRWRFPYARAHDHAWTNVILWCVGWAFVGVVFILAFLLAALFGLIGIDFLEKLLREQWFMMPLAGLALGVGLGRLRERDRIVEMLQGVAMTVLGVLAPVLGAGLVFFLLALPFTGLDALWDATKATTPILLACVVGALVLTNAVLGNRPEEEAKTAVLRWGAMALGLVMLPLAVIAAIATGLRIGQYGLTPDRLWALTFVVLATAFGLAYLVSLARGRMNWAEHVRPANLRLAFGTCVVALLLATPLSGFNALSTRDQVGRLEAGKVTPDKFDWAALAFDFGEPGRAALKRLAGSANAVVRNSARVALKAGSRYDLQSPADPQAEKFTGPVEVHPAGAVLAESLRAAVTQGWHKVCAGEGLCRVYLQPDGRTAVAVNDGCAGPKVTPAQQADPSFKCAVDITAFSEKDGAWARAERKSRIPSMTAEEQRESLRREREAIAQGQVRVAPAPLRQVYVGDKPVGEPFE